MECMVELATLQDNKKGVVVITRSDKTALDDCLKIFNSIISCVMEAKAEFCHSVKPDFFLIDSTEAANYLNEDHLFAMSDVERVLGSLEGKRSVVSVTGRRMMMCEEIVCLRKFTHWDSLFPMDVTNISHLLQDVVSASDMCRLGLNLNLPMRDLLAIEQDFPTDTERRRIELVRRWLSSSRDPPCWWHLVQALKTIDENVLAEKIEKEHSK